MCVCVYMCASGIMCLQSSALHMHVHVYVWDACLPISDVHALYIDVQTCLCGQHKREGAL